MPLPFTLNISQLSLDHVNVDCENSLFLVFDNEDGYIDKIDENKYLVFAFTDKNKEIFKKYTGL